MFYYALTLRKTVPVSDVYQAENVIKRYYEMIRYFKRINTDVYIEPTLETVPHSKGKHNVHLHAMVKSQRPLALSQWPKQKGMHIHFEECKSQLAWDAYIAKDSMVMQDILDIIEAYNSYSDDSAEYSVKTYKKLV